MHPRMPEISRTETKTAVGGLAGVHDLLADIW
jgi:hypothetical protein